MEEFDSRALEMRCRRVDVDTLEIALEVCCMCSDVEEAQSFGAGDALLEKLVLPQELWRHAAGVASLSQELERIVCCCWNF